MANKTDRHRRLDRHAAAALVTVPRLFALDLDGTLLSSDHQVSSATKAAVAHVRRRGAEVLLASSRGPRAMEPTLRSLQLTDPAAFVGSQGAITGSYAAEGGLRVIDRQPIPPDLAKSFVKRATAAGIAVSWFTGPHWYVSFIDHTIEQEAHIVQDTPLVRDLLAENSAPDKLLVIAPTRDLTPLAMLSGDLPRGLAAQASNPNYLEITRFDVDKASAVKKFCQTKGISSAEVVAIGDGPNDLGLFAFAGISIAPANARPQVLQAALFLTRSNDEDGVAYALTTLIP